MTNAPFNPDTFVYDDGAIDLDGRLIRLTKGPVTVYLTKDGTKGVVAPSDPQYVELAKHMGSLLGKNIDEAFQTRPFSITAVVEKPLSPEATTMLAMLEDDAGHRAASAASLRRFIQTGQWEKPSA